MTATSTIQRLIDDLRAALGHSAIDTSEPGREAVAEDALGRRAAVENEAVTPIAVVRPVDTEGVAAALRLANEARVPVVPYGAGTGLMGGARSVGPSLVIDTSALDSIEVRAEDRLVWAGAGAVLAAVDAALREQGLCLGHDPWTFPVASVGGPISTNGLGYKGGRYGGMGDQVVALEVALADGTIFRTRPVPRRSTGPDLARLFVGAEGTLGVVTAAALRAFAVPERLEFAAYRFATFESGFAAVQEMSLLGLGPALLDYGEQHASPWNDRTEEPPALYLAFEGFEEEVAASLARTSRITAGHGAEALPQQEARDLWDSRHVIAERFARDRRAANRSAGPRREGRAFDYIHVALPASRVLPFREDVHGVAGRNGVQLGECGLWTAPEMFSASMTLADDQGGQGRLSEVIDELLRACQDLGGSMEYCHGAGIRLAHLMEREHGAGMEVLRTVKAALDPNGVLNPGKLGL